jgi:hypothetical protein
MIPMCPREPLLAKGDPRSLKLISYLELLVIMAATTTTANNNNNHEDRDVEGEGGSRAGFETNSAQGRCLMKMYIIN